MTKCFEPCAIKTLQPVIGTRPYITIRILYHRVRFIRDQSRRGGVMNKIIGTNRLSLQGLQEEESRDKQVIKERPQKNAFKVFKFNPMGAQEEDGYG
jgi:hypothetical protein